MNAWQTLGLTPSASTEQIHAAHRKLILRFHPDVAPPGQHAIFEERAKAINAAKDLLLHERHLRAPAVAEAQSVTRRSQTNEAPRPRSAASSSPIRGTIPNSRIRAKPTAPPRAVAKPGSLVWTLVVGYFLLLGLAFAGWILTALLPAVRAILGY